jgi:signal transduction histidine kinase
MGAWLDVSETTDQLRTPEDLAAELQEANRRLLVAGLAAQEHAETQTALNDALRDLLETRERAAVEREILLERERAARDLAEVAVRVRDEFLAIASHELRTPLTAVKGTAQMALRALERGVLDEARMARHFQSIEASAARLEQLLLDLMDVSRMRSEGPIIRPVAMDLATLVRSLAQRYADGSGDLHRVITHLPDGPLLVEGDQGRLQQVLDNMLSNAVKYTPAGGEITVSLGEVRPGSSFVTLGINGPWAQDERDGALLSVVDTGIGIPPEEQERIFEPFGRATNATRHGLPGMGMGLYICRQIVEAHGGRMWFESAGEGRGTAMSVWLPLPPPGNASDQAASEQGEN